MKEDILALIIEAVTELNQELNIPQLNRPVPSTSLYGSKGNLDSIGLVRLIADIESMISMKFNQQIVLADEKAMSRSRSPFKSIEVLADYVEERLNEGDSSQNADDQSQ